MWWTADEDVTLSIDYVVDGEFVIPTAAWAVVRDHLGVVIPGLEAVNLATSSTTASLTILAANNAVASGMDFSNRYISVFFNHGGAQYRRELSYRLHPFVPMTVTHDDVRRELGLGTDELPDRDINIYGAYLALKDEYGIDTALLAGDLTNQAANQAIAVKAAIELTWSLPFRAAVKMKSEDAAIDRMSEFDPMALRIQLGQRLAGFLDIVDGTTNTGTVSLVLSTPTDVITGE